jgi:cell division inhibitor SepF
MRRPLKHPVRVPAARWFTGVLMCCGRVPLLGFGGVRLVSTEASAVRRNARTWLGLDGGDASEDVSGIQDGNDPPSGLVAVGNGIRIAIVRPRNFRDAVTIGEYYRREIPVIVNLEDMDKAEATRIIDFVSGLILGLFGDIERLSRRIFLVVPAGAAIFTAHDGLTDESFFNQALRRPTWSGGYWSRRTCSSQMRVGLSWAGS